MLGIIRNLKMSQKLLVAPLVVMLFLFILAFVSYRSFATQKDALSDIYNVRFTNFRTVAGYRTRLEDVHANLYKVLRWSGAGTSEKKVETLGHQQLQALQQIKEAVGQSLRTLKLTPEEKEILQSSQDLLRAYREYAFKVFWTWSR